MIKKVAIICVGLGSLAVAIALHKQVINAQVYEKAQVSDHEFEEWLL